MSITAPAEQIDANQDVLTHIDRVNNATFREVFPEVDLDNNTELFSDIVTAIRDARLYTTQPDQSGNSLYMFSPWMLRLAVLTEYRQLPYEGDRVHYKAAMMDTVGIMATLEDFRTGEPEIAATLLKPEAPNTSTVQAVNNLLEQRFQEVSETIATDPTWTKDANDDPIEFLSWTREFVSGSVAIASVTGSPEVISNTATLCDELIAKLSRQHPELRRTVDMSLQQNDWQQKLAYIDALDTDAPGIINFDNLVLSLAHARETLEDALTDPVRARRDYLNAWQKITQLAQTKQLPVAEAFDFKPMELNWEILPPGELTTTATDIVEGLQKSGREVTIDLERLKALEAIRELWGPGDSYYAKGALKKRGIIRRASQEPQADEYILLILQDHTADGSILEHAVAESPIAGPHAMYIFRQDVNTNVHWRQVMSLSKKDARALGARPIKHTGESKSDSMADKAFYLLACDTHEFKRLKFNGRKGYWIPKNAVELGA